MEFSNKETLQTLQSMSNPQQSCCSLENDSSCSEDETYSIDDALDKLRFGSFQFLLLFYTGLAWMSEAMDLMLLSFIGPSLRAEWNLSGAEETQLSTFLFLGMLFGAYTWGILADTKGRKIGFTIPAILTSVSALLSSLSPSLPALFFFRFLVGVGLGGAPVLFSLFLEFVPLRNRGFWSIVFSLFWTFGSISEALLAWVRRSFFSPTKRAHYDSFCSVFGLLLCFSHFPLPILSILVNPLSLLFQWALPLWGWRILLVLSSLPLAFLLFLVPFLPESPRFLLSIGEFEKAEKVLSLVAKTNNSSLPVGKLSPQVPLNSPPVNPQVPFSFWGKLGTLISPPFVGPTFLLWGIFFSNAFCYYGIVLLSSTLSFSSSSSFPLQCPPIPPNEIGLPPSSPLFSQVLLTSVAEAPGTLLASILVDKMGRKRTMAALLSLCSLSLFSLLFCLNFPFFTPNLLLISPENSPEIHLDSLLVPLLFSARAFIMGSFQVALLFAPELYPTGLRATGMGAANSFSRLGGLACPFVAVELVRTCQEATAVSLLAGVALLAALAALAFPLETSGRALRD